MPMGGSASASGSSWVMRAVRIERDVVVEGGRAVSTGLYMIDVVESARRRLGKWGCTWSCGRRCACGVYFEFLLNLFGDQADERDSACICVCVVDARG